MAQQPPTPAPAPGDPSLNYTFRRVAGLGVDFLGARSLDAMDAWEVDPPGWESQWYRHMGRECRDIYVCPGCEAWQVEYSAHGYALVSLDEPDAELAPFAASDLADEHRVECAIFDVFAGLAGVAGRDRCTST